MNNVITIDVIRDSTSEVDAELLLAVKGQKGDTGETPHLSVGSVSTVDAGSSASVTIVGTDEDPILNFEIPRGETGQTGQTGETGNGISTLYFDEENRLTVELTDGQSATSDPMTETVKVDAYLIHFDKTATLTSSVTTVDLDMAGYEYDLTDIIFVYINGLMGIPTVDYNITVNGDLATVNFTMENPSSESVFIRIIKARADFSLLMSAVGSVIVTDDDEPIGV